MFAAAIAAAILFAVLATALTRLTAQCGPNPIVCENQLTGAQESQWDVNAAGDDSIQGFATDISVNVGETVHFKVDTDAATFNAVIYRMGYYAGRGARQVASITGIAGQNQPNCINNASTGLNDCGNWAESMMWTVPSTAVSGIYFAKLTRPDTGGSSHIVFVVRNDQYPSDLLFQTSDTTWQAYNTYGGNSLYVGSPAGRAYKVSYNRPVTTRSTSPEDFVFNAEYPMVRWLEANGYNLTYSTGVDTDRRGATELTRHRAFLSVEAARDAGVHLAFFSGNEVFWKTRWESSIDGRNTPYRTLVSYKETHANAKIDPLDPPTWTGTWRDPRFSPPADGGRPENALTGTIFTVNCCTNATIRVTSTYKSLPFWRNTRVATLANGASTTLTAGMLNYEWDEDLNNGFRPAGLTRLSATTVNGVSKLQDYGSSYATGNATHALTLYRHSSGALVFGAGTVQWSWGLDNDHDRGSAAADTAVRQATVNLFSDMGVQPGSLQPGLVPGTPDSTPPGSTITSPASGASFMTGTPVTISGTASDTGTGQVARVDVSTDGGTNWNVAFGTTSWTYQWTPSAAGQATLRSRATDNSGNVETPSAGVTVTVIAPPPDVTPPTVGLTAPADGSTVSGTAVAVSANAGDNVGVVGVQFLLDGSIVIGAEDTTSPYSVNWNSTGAANGSHVLTARARDAAGNATTSSPVTVTVSNTTPTGLSIDTNVFGDQPLATRNSVTTAAFSTTSTNQLLLALIGADDSSAGNTVTSVTGGGLTWALVLRTNTRRGTAEIWRAFAPAALTNVTVTATMAQNCASSLVVLSVRGADTTGANGSGAIGATRSANGASGAQTASVTTTRAGSWVFGVGVDWDRPVARTLGPNQTLIHQYMPPVGDTYWVQSMSAPTPLSGTNVTINDTAPTTDQWNLSVCEILPALQ
jgi:N,N-dimethylformamidase beta subunit-like protein/Big-like domain-containing protein